MKAFASPRTGRVSPSEALTPSSQKQRAPRIPKENVDPCPAPSDRSPFRSPANTGKPLSAKNRSPLPPRPPLPSKQGANPLKRKLSSEIPAENGGFPSSASDSGVQVIVRMRPPDKVEEETNLIVEKVSENSVTVFDHTFTFDSVADIRSTQEDMFRLVGIPLVETCLAGFNSSIFAYGQTGSGKTYTMWGPPSALSDYASSSIDKGLTPRVFERLFSRIDEERAKHSDKQLNYQCRCSFLEIYNEQITDLLEPTRRNLQIREDVKTGVYVDFLTEEYVSTINDVNQLLVKGLANRRTGATQINMESSRSHCVFTCIIESHSKSTADGLISIKTSRINLVDLAGSERQKQTRAAGEQLKEASNINRSLSQLGNLINILAEVSKSWKQRHIPYRDSKLTFLLQESLGGNAKLAMICAISPLRSCKNETLSTLRFAQRAKSIKNKAVVNEVMQDDVNVLREQIRLLKDELLRMKSNGSSDNNGGYSTAWNARRSLHILKMSLARPKPLPVVKDDSDEEMEIDENDVEMLDTPQSVCVVKSAVLTISKETKLKEIELVQVSAKSDEKTANASNTDGLNNQQDDNRVILMNDQRIQTFPSDKLPTEIIHSTDIGQVIAENPSKNSLSLSSTISPSSLSTVPCYITPIPQVPPLSASTVIDTCSRKSPRMSLPMSASPKNTLGNSKSTGITNALSAATLSAFASLNCQTKNSPKPTECLAASLQCGLQMIDKRQLKSVQRDSSLTVRPTDDRQIIPINKVDIGTQTPLQDSQELELPIMLNYCQKVSGVETANVNRSKDMQLVLADGLTANDKHNIHVPKAVEQVLAGSIRREMALEDLTTEQAAEMAQLKLLAQQYKYERDCNAMIDQIREDKIARLESLMDGILPTEEFMQEEFIALENEHKLLKEKYENHPEILQLNIKLKKVQDELDGYRNFFEMSERDVLMEEIQDLRSQLQYYIDPTCSESTQKQSSLLRLTHQGRTIVPLSTISELSESGVDNKESKYSLVEELRFELEGSRRLAEKLKRELDSEKKCTEELKEALQTAMQSHTRILEQYADLQEKHTTLLSWNRKINDGIDDVMKAATEAGIRGAESKFLSSLASEISVLKAEREREKQKWQEKNRALEAQLADTADALEAAGEVLVRLKEAEETAAVAERRALLAEKETEKMNQEIVRLKKNLDIITAPVNCTTAESNLPRDLDHTETGGSKADSDYTESDGSEKAKFDAGKSTHPWTEEFEPFCKRGDTELSIDTDPTSWFSGYDRCNI